MKPILSICILILIISQSCKKDNNEKDDYKANENFIQNEELFNSIACFTTINLHANAGFVIKDSATYANYADSMRVNPINANCDTATLKTIDFKKYSLIGINTKYGACDSLIRKLMIDKEKGKITYNIQIIENKNKPCVDVLITSLNLVQVTKIPDNFKVDFNVLRQ